MIISSSPVDSRFDSRVLSKLDEAINANDRKKDAIPKSHIKIDDQGR